MKTKISIIASLIAISFFFSCDSNDKNDSNSTNSAITNEQIATDSKIDAAIDDVTNIVDDQYTMRQSITSKSITKPKTMLPSCVTVAWTYADGVFNGSIDFGTEGCTLENGNVLKGKITLSFSGNFGTTEQNITYTFDNFYHNGKNIQGTKSITRSVKATELLEEAHPVYEYSIDMTITFEDGSIYTRKGIRTKEQIEGFDTGEWIDNVYLVIGNETTAMPNGDSWSSTIETPLRYEMSCKKPFPVSGTIIKVKNDIETTVDFGTGECDNSATVTTSETTVTIELKK
ncbi:hypothetical protein [Flavobacterium adhaerens]|uniref:hypothetical protein n=1 Tax=Flavobacterium adhaerens TaxID=3149043 RepID=UPI0032B4972E